MSFYCRHFCLKTDLKRMKETFLFAEPFFMFSRGLLSTQICYKKTYSKDSQKIPQVKGQ